MVAAGLPTGHTIVLPESPAFETRLFAGDPFARSLDLEAGANTLAAWPTLHLVDTTIQVKEADGTTLSGRYVLLLRVGPDATLEDIRRHAFVGSKALALDAQGTVTARGLLPGRYYLSIMGRGSSSHSFEVLRGPTQVVLIQRP